MTKIIDMRCRPAYLHDFFGKTPGSPDYDVVRWLNRRVARGAATNISHGRPRPKAFWPRCKTPG